MIAWRPYDTSVKPATEDLVLSWPTPSLPGICARTGVPTRAGVVLTPRGAGYAGAEVILPFSQAATLRQRALRRLAALAAIVAVAFAVGAGFAWFLAFPAVISLAVAGYAWRQAHAMGIYPVVEGRQLVLPHVHPAFAAAVAAMPERCGRDEGGGCETCTSSCLPQVQTT